MSGHSHWARIKHQKGTADARRGQLFSKLTRHILSAARQGGADPDKNLKLAYAIEKAREASMPKDNIDRAIQRAQGHQGAHSALEEALYEAYGLEGAAILIETLTDNRNRTAAEIRKILETKGGRLAGTGAVAWNFEKKGMVWVSKEGLSEEQALAAALEAGADDLEVSEGAFLVQCAPRSFHQVREGLAQKGLTVTKSELGMVPKSLVQISAGGAERMVELLEELESHEDVQNVYTQFYVAEGKAAKGGSP